MEEKRRDGDVLRRRRSQFPDQQPVRRRSTISIECGGIRMKAGRKHGFT